MGGATLPKNKINNNQEAQRQGDKVRQKEKMKNFKNALSAIIERQGNYILDFQEYNDGHITANFDVFANIISVSVYHRGKYNHFLSRRAFNKMCR